MFDRRCGGRPRNLIPVPVADRFVARSYAVLWRSTILRHRSDIETGLTGRGNIAQLSRLAAQPRSIIDGVMARAANFGWTMAPETAYVTGGSVTYGSSGRVPAGC